MDTNQQPKAAHLAQELKAGEWSPNILQNEVALRQCAAEELLRQHAEIETLRTGYNAARLEIESLQTRIQELGQQARECSDRKVVQLDARIKELEGQLDAVGAGGVGPLRKTNSVEFDGIKTYHGQLLRAALQEAEAALEVALARILKRDPGHAVNVTSEAKALVIVRSALAESQTNHFRGATEMVQASAPVVLPAPDVFAKVSHKGAAKWDVEFTWPVGKFEEDGDHKLYTEQQVRAMLATATGLPAQAARTWSCPVRTVADLANNLLTMDQTLPIYGAQYIEHPAGRRRAIAVPPTVSIERVKDSRWIGEGDELNAAIIWTQAEQPAAPQAQADARDALEEAASVLSSINKGASHEVQVGDEVCYWQRKEWIEWAEKEVLPKVRAAIAAAQKDE